MSLADVSCEAWFRWAGDSAALLGVRVEAPRDMGFLRGRHDEKNGYLLEIWREVRPKQWKWRTYRRRDVCASPVFFLHDAHFVDEATIADLRLGQGLAKFARVEGEISVDLSCSSLTEPCVSHDVLKLFATDKIRV